MDRPGHEFFAGPGFPGDQHRRRGRPDRFRLRERPAEGFTPADHRTEIVRGAKFLDQILILAGQLLPQSIDLLI